jgi:predicted amidohydrolase YtcJ
VPTDGGLLVARAEVAGRVVDVRIAGGVVAEVGPRLRPSPREDVLDARGGALLPGLHDHHLHLLAMAAAGHSVDCGPPHVRTAARLRDGLRAAPGTGWVRGVGYHESVAGPLDRDVLDRMVPDRPVRVQHRSGALWMVNSAGLALLAADLAGPDVERTVAGRPTGRLWRYDARLPAILGARPPDLAAVSARLSGYGITGVTDATPDDDGAGRATITAAVLAGTLRQRVHLLGAAGSDDDDDTGITTGPRKLLLRDHDLPGFDELAAMIAASHAVARPVAVHCVSREALLLTLAALELTGAMAGDRVEHAAVVPVEIRDRLALAGLRVVTQPSFVARRGDDYLAAVDREDRALLYPYASLLAAGVPVAPSSDAPFGDPDPWHTIAAAVARRTPSGAALNPGERVPARVVLDGFLSGAGTPGGRPRRIAPGAAADLCLLAAPLASALARPAAELVRTVIRGGVPRMGA